MSCAAASSLSGIEAVSSWATIHSSQQSYDRSEGVQWLEYAAQNGNDCAAYRLGKEYLKGEIGERDTAKAGGIVRLVTHGDFLFSDLSQPLAVLVCCAVGKETIPYEQTKTVRRRHGTQAGRRTLGGPDRGGPQQPLAVDPDAAGDRRSWGLILKDPAHVVEQPGNRQHERGRLQAVPAVGILYRDGPVLIPDSVEAAGWFEQAARQSVIAAQYELGVLLYDSVLDRPEFFLLGQWWPLAFLLGIEIVDLTEKK